MNCEEARAAFTDLYDGMLSGSPLVALSEHLDGCSTCRREWEAFRKTMQALNDLGNEEPSAGFATRVADRIQAPPWWRKLAAALVLPLHVKLPIHATALVLLGIAGVWIFQQSPDLRRATNLQVPAPPERPAALFLPRRDTPSPTPTPETPPAPPKAPGPQESAPAPPRSAAGGKVGVPEPPREAGRASEAPSITDKALRPMTLPPPAVAKKEEEDAGTAAPRPPESTQSLPESRATARADLPAKGGALSVRSRETGNELFSAAATEFAAQRYETAIENLRAFLTHYPKDGRAPDARFLLADAYLAQGRHTEARSEFETFLQQYPEHRKAPAALYRTGEIRVRLGDQSGCDILRDALARNPTTREAASARDTLSARCP